MTSPERGVALSLREWPLLVVAAGVLVGLVVAIVGDAIVGDATWRLGCVLIGASLLVGAVERLVLPGRGAGLLQVRGKPFDVSVLALAGVAVVALAVVVPPGR